MKEKIFLFYERMSGFLQKKDSRNKSGNDRENKSGNDGAGWLDKFTNLPGMTERAPQDSRKVTLPAGGPGSARAAAVAAATAERTAAAERTPAAATA